VDQHELQPRARLLPIFGIFVLVAALLAVGKFATSNDPPSADTPASSPSTATAPASGTTDSDVESKPRDKKHHRNGKSDSKRERRLSASLRDRVQDAADGLEPDAAAFRMVSFNVLGYSHTKPGGNKCCRWAGGVTRMSWALQLVRGTKAGVVGFQEFEKEQYGVFMSLTGGSWSAYPGMRLGSNPVRNSIAWNTSVFELVEAHTIPIPYFHGKLVPMPYVLLKHKETGRLAWFINIHNPASVRGPAQHWRDVATSKEIALMNDLQAPQTPGQIGIPTFLMGDFNEKSEAFCRVTAGAQAQAANGGASSPCRLPGNHGIDWIFGSDRGVAFYNYTRVNGGLVNRASDHPMVYTDVQLTGDAPWIE